MPPEESLTTSTHPSAGKGCGPVCCLSFSESGVVNWLTYGDAKRSIRTYSPGRVDRRFLGLAPRFCDDLAAHCGEGKGYFVVPVRVAQHLANPDQVFATPDEYPDYFSTSPSATTHDGDSHPASPSSLDGGALIRWVEQQVTFEEGHDR